MWIIGGLKMDISNQKHIMEWFADKWAALYQKEHDKSPKAASVLLENAQAGLEYFLRDGFARAGGEQAGYGDIAVNALRNCVSSAGDYKTLILKENADQIVWTEFERFCMRKNRGINKRLNEGVVKGFVSLVKEFPKFDNNPFRYLAQKMENSMTEAFLTLRNIKGIGDKIATFLLRDIVCILNLETKVPIEHRIFLQPVDRWVKETALILWEDLMERVPSWVIALQIVDKCKEFGVSGVRFNQGAWKYGTKEVGEVKNLRSKLETLFL